MHPLVSELDKMSETELEQKIHDLTKKYYMTTNAELQNQIIMIIDDYKSAITKKQQDALTTAMENRNKGLDKLINIG